jgi:D-amino-acid dehydrogenase
MVQLKAYLYRNGVRILTNEEVRDFELEGGRIKTVITNKAQYTADEVVLASGSWSQRLSKKLGLNLAVQAGKGYRINVSRPTGIRLPAILMEAKVAVTPMTGFTRFAGTMELSGINHHIRAERVRAIAMAAESFYARLKISDQELSEAKCGLRPVTPDGLPYIGRPTRHKNLLVATGHAMMGWSLGPATGKLVSELVSGKKPSMKLDGFHPDRKF